MPAVPGAGRKPVPIDLEDLEKLCGLQCTDEEIAAWFGISKQAFEKRKLSPRKFEYPIRDAKGAVVRTELATIREVYDRGKLKGKASVRRSLFALAQRGQQGAAAAAIFLAKNVLGYRDVSRDDGADKAAPTRVEYGWVEPRSSEESNTHLSPANDDSTNADLGSKVTPVQ